VKRRYRDVAEAIIRLTLARLRTFNQKPSVNNLIRVASADIIPRLAMPPARQAWHTRLLQTRNILADKSAASFHRGSEMHPDIDQASEGLFNLAYRHMYVTDPDRSAKFAILNA
jgi:hypothetical protein